MSDGRSKKNSIFSKEITRKPSVTGQVQNYTAVSLCRMHTQQARGTLVSHGSNKEESPAQHIIAELSSSEQPSSQGPTFPLGTQKWNHYDLNTTCKQKHHSKKFLKHHQADGTEATFPDLYLRVASQGVIQQRLLHLVKAFLHVPPVRKPSNI